ncbi:hypothetical protein Tco_0070662 [Tanacetum coccineum]
MTIEGQKSIIEGHLSALKELLKEPSNRDLIKPLLLNFNDQDEDVDDEVEEVFKRNKEKAVMTNPKDKGKVVAMDDLSKPFKEVLKCPFTKYGKSRGMTHAGVVLDVPINTGRESTSVV